MEKKNWLEIARPGTFTDSSGRQQCFTEGDLQNIAKAYLPEKRECPLVFGHPQSDSAPAFGWAAQVKCENGKLLAQFEKVPDAVKKLVNDGHYRHVSMSLMPDRVTLRHVALLGAAQPAIDGLKAVELRSRDEDCITVDFANLSHPEGDKHMDEAQREIGALKERLAALEKENADLKKQVAVSKQEKDKADVEKKAAEDKAEKTAADFAAYRGQIENERRENRVSAMVAAGKITPAEKTKVLQFAQALAQQTQTMDFAAQDGSIEKISLEENYLRELEARQPDGRSLDFSLSRIEPKKETVNLTDLTMKL